jgi:hypothetical protein
MEQDSSLSSSFILKRLSDDDLSSFGVRRLREHVGRVGYDYCTHLYKPLDYGLKHAMTPEQYLIVLHNNEWKIIFKEKHYGPYDTQGEAIEAAIDAAYAMGEIGIDAQVLVQEADNKLRIEWAYGQSINTFR